MCGLVVVIDHESVQAVSLGCQDATMVERLHHRGLDGSGTWPQSPVSSGNCRLSILWLSDVSAQLKISVFDRWVVAFKGELQQCPRFCHGLNPAIGLSARFSLWR